MEKIDLSIVIVHYNTPELLYNCINSISKSKTLFSFEIIVIDNNSQFKNELNILEQFKSVKWINNGYNAGFSRANNLGIKNANGEFILLLNPDTEINKLFLDKIINSYKDQDKLNNLGLLTCRIISLKDKSLLIGSKKGFPSFIRLLNENPLVIFIRRILYISYKKKYNPYVMHKKNHKIDVASGSCVLTKKSKIKKKSLYLDEDFFLYSEDVEWSYRFKKNGFINMFIGDIEVFHVNSAATSKNDNLDSQKYASELLFYFKAYGKIRFLFICSLINFNYSLNIYLLNRAGNLEEKLKYLNMKSELKRISNIIKGNYSNFPSSNKDFLKIK